MEEQNLSTQGEENIVPKNIFRPVYEELSEEDKKHVEDIKNKASELWHLFPKNGDMGANREIAVAITKLEESVMWAVKGITK
ncbi:MAG: hypothetical protein RBR97_20210 [Bacteroidales bacterium]|nr:hypothetical protein [Bacteroidales bacterium]